ncbi:AraC family transcriptional regulator [Pectobacterium polaris]|uniref:AraC family transcriptional regulator n=1 Tax=Pectobacterium polaris TaxID=2042057 RepID=UPI0019694796|nr:AraC family transcriptional regulator [Pectobacterium polaris]MBN3214489.1 AraC family transcriptional regulator [Pectobacterium polaris]
MSEKPEIMRCDDLAEIISKYLADEGDIDTGIAELSLFRRNIPEQPSFCMVEPSIILVVQGTKQIIAGGDTYRYDPSRFLLTSLDLPATSQAITASPDVPCLGLMLKLDMQMISEIIRVNGDLITKRSQTPKGIETGLVTPTLLDSFRRLLALLDEPEAIPVLAPLLKKEIHYRLIKSDQAQRLCEIASIESHGYRIAKAIDWMKLNYTSAIKIDELAAKAQMSRPSFHHHFKQLTSMSPIQYQKWLRLNEAKRLMLNERLDAATTSYRVGYESPSQFSREYNRLFGSPPKKDINSLKGK